jgi:predicted ArsR family transcriptional regulator
MAAETSLLAFESITTSGKRKTQAKLVYDAIKRFHGGVNARQLSIALHIEKSTIHARLNDLLGEGIIYECYTRPWPAEDIRARPMKHYKILAED